MSDQTPHAVLVELLLESNIGVVAGKAFCDWIASEAVSRLSEHGYSIVPSADVKSVRMVAEYALHLRINGERAPGGDETWAKFDRFAEAVLRATGPAAAAAEAPAVDPDETAGQYMHRTGDVPPWWFTAAVKEVEALDAAAAEEDQ